MIGWLAYCRMWLVLLLPLLFDHVLSEGGVMPRHQGVVEYIPKKLLHY